MKFKALPDSHRVLSPSLFLCSPLSPVITDIISFSEIAVSFYTSSLSLQLWWLMILYNSSWVPLEVCPGQAFPKLERFDLLSMISFFLSTCHYWGVSQDQWAFKESDLICGLYPQHLAQCLGYSEYSGRYDGGISGWLLVRLCIVLPFRVFQISHSLVKWEKRSQVSLSR